MTSMPASRRQRATTLTPRSWPSRPTLASSTRMFSDTLGSSPGDAGSSISYAKYEFQIRLAAVKTWCDAGVARRGGTGQPGGAKVSRMRNPELDRLDPGPTLIDRAYEAILGAVCSGELAPGERLNQDELAARLHISRQPVGQALTILKSQGF